MHAETEQDINNVFPLRTSTVLATVAKAYGVTVEDLTNHDRHAPLGAARKVAYRLLHDECRLGWQGVATVMNRDPSGGWLGPLARTADPLAVTAILAQLHPDGHQETLW